MLHFPEHGDVAFRDKLMELEEYQMFQIPVAKSVHDMGEYEERVAQYCSGFEKTLYQHLMQHYLSYRSPYRSLLLFHGLGVGKTCSSITIAESMLVDHSSREAPRVWVILPTTLQDSYQDQLFSLSKLLDIDKMMEQCTGLTYAHLTASAKDAEAKRKRILQVIKSRYKMMTYEGFASEVEKLKANNLLHTITNKVIIVDEAHNLRIEETDKRAAAALMEVATNCQNNRLVLLSATPMYNEPDEIFWLLSLLLANDKRHVPSFGSLFTQRGQPSKLAFAKLQQLASEYISYIRGHNPFTFATKLSPSVNGVPLLGDAWTQGIKDGIVPTELGENQKAAIPTLKKSDAVLHQANNVCFPSSSGYKVGKKGFESVFGRETIDSPFQYKNKEFANMLMPVEDKLGKYGSKLKYICECIKQSHGIVVVYSQFVWGGIVPLAMALEHMGFQRHGATNLLLNPEIVAPRTTYVNVPFPSYCIISGDPQVMGSTNIAELVRDINRDDNKYGERIKVVLMSPIAGEGLSLRNTREVHIMDPWYHVNRIQQVVGRAIRTCSHTGLPIKERNVTVYLHAATNGTAETMDLHTYKIAARKSSQTHQVEEAIRDHALDCALVKGVHYYPKSLFHFNVRYETSRGVEVIHRFGDDDTEEPKCSLPSASNSITMRSEIVSELVPTGLQRLRRYLRPKRGLQLRFTEAELVDVIKFPSKVAKIVLGAACHPNALFDGFTLVPHRNGFVLEAPIQPMKPSKIRVTTEPSNKAVINEKSDFEGVLSAISVSNEAAATIQIYQSLDSDQWPDFAKRVIEYGGKIPNRIQDHVDILVKQGAFVSSKELPSHKPLGRSEIIGFVDIYDTKAFHVILWDVERAMYRDATTTETTSIMAKREKHEKPSMSQYKMLFGAYEPHKFKNQTATRFEFKLYIPGPSVGTRTGIVCINTKKPSIVEGLNSLGKEISEDQMKKETKDTLCFTLGMELLAKNRLFLAPSYKPKKV